MADFEIEPDEQPLSDDCGCMTRVSGDGALIVIRDADCEQHRVSILDAQP